MLNSDDRPLYQHRRYTPLRNRYTLLYVSILVLSFAAFLIGYGKFIFSGALVKVERTLELRVSQIEVLVSSLFVAAIFGSAAAWPLGKFLGRKVSTLISGAFIIVGTIILALSNDYASLMIGRSILGFGVGLIGVVTLIYMSEIVPANIRGSSVCLLNLTFHVGLVLSYLLSWGLFYRSDWKWLVASSIFPSVAFFILMFFIPETPQWYISKNQFEKAKQVLNKLRRVHDTELELEAIEDNFESHESLGKKFWGRGVFKALFVGVCIGIFMEATGLDAILYYGPLLLKHTGFTSDRSSVIAIFWISVSSLCFSFIAILLIDIWGRRKLLLSGTCIMIISLVLLGLMVRYGVTIERVQGFMLFLLMLFAAGFTIGLGSVGFLLISELFPLRIRSFAVATSLTVKWIANFLIGRYSLSTVSLYGAHITFWMYAGISLIALIFVYYLVPETSGKTLEEIEEFWIKEAEHGTNI